jgi:ectoine hydroxylase-related dioxygenase (phytanoyl-CoA dioxygenase family)
MDAIDANTEHGYFGPADCRIEDLRALTARSVDPAAVPHAEGAPSNVPVYDMQALSGALESPPRRRALMAEWAAVLRHGAGVFVLRRACPDLSAIDAATQAFEAIIAQEKLQNGGGADHFAAAGSNDRIWNSLQKLALAAPETFVRYFASPAIHAACEAWLGPGYQMTAQINLVHPGGKAQQAHRDYHLGFQTAEVSMAYPAHVHDLSPLMTLQGGIAHGDVPVESGPTKLLPFSQLYRPGYVAWRREEFQAHFEAHHVQLPLAKGDALFFNPALFHAAGENVSPDIHRMVNLLQVSSAFGRAMESVDRLAMCRALYAPLCAAWSEGRLSEPQLDAVIAAAAEGYAFPTNLDRDPPVGGLAPQTQHDLLRIFVVEARPPPEFVVLMMEQAARQEP